MPTQYNRFSIQILGTVDALSTETLLNQVNTALSSIPKFNIKAVSHDKWADGFTGEDRLFDESGKEIIKQNPIPEDTPTTIPLTPVKEVDVVVTPV